MPGRTRSLPAMTAAMTTCLLVPALLSACTDGRRPGFPAPVVDREALIAAIEARFNLPERIVAHYELEASHVSPRPDTESAQHERRRIERNEIIGIQLLLTDLRYQQFIADASFNRQAFDLSTDLLDLGVDLASTAVGSSATKSMLGAMSAGITGARSSLHANTFFEQTTAALIAAMNARRKQALLPILEGAALEIDRYPLAQALADLDAYVFAGTFPGALQSIQQQAATAEHAATQHLHTLRGVSAPAP